MAFNFIAVPRNVYGHVYAICISEVDTGIFVSFKLSTMIQLTKTIFKINFLFYICFCDKKMIIFAFPCTVSIFRQYVFCYCKQKHIKLVKNESV